MLTAPAGSKCAFCYSIRFTCRDADHIPMRSTDSQGAGRASSCGPDAHANSHFPAGAEHRGLRVRGKTTAEIYDAILNREPEPHRTPFMFSSTYGRAPDSAYAASPARLTDPIFITLGWTSFSKSSHAIRTSSRCEPALKAISLSRDRLSSAKTGIA
jgi:hypothetical protein